MKLSFINLTTFNISQDFFEKALKAVEKNESALFKFKAYKKDISIEIALIGQNRMRDINKRFAGRNQVTDVLSFPESEIRKSTKKELVFTASESECFPIQPFIQPTETEKSLGEVLLCPSRIKKQAKKFKKEFEEELLFCFIHGLLHILGYNHRDAETTKKMRKKEKEIMKVLRIKN